MILAPIRAVHAWLSDATYGANAQIANITRDGSDAVPTSYAAIKEETTSSIVALGTVPKSETTPLLLVFQSGEWQGEGNVVLASQQDGELEIGIADVISESDAAEGLRDAHYRIAAVRKSLNLLHSNTHVASRKRANVQIRNGGITWRLTRPRIELEGAVVAAGLLVRYHIRELNP